MNRAMLKPCLHRRWVVFGPRHNDQRFQVEWGKRCSGCGDEEIRGWISDMLLSQHRYMVERLGLEKACHAIMSGQILMPAKKQG